MCESNVLIMSIVMVQLGCSATSSYMPAPGGGTCSWGSAQPLVPLSSGYNYMCTACTVVRMYVPTVFIALFVYCRALALLLAVITETTLDAYIRRQQN
jgi:hypothetical protein